MTHAAVLDKEGVYDKAMGAMLTDYTPFHHYLRQYENVTRCVNGPRTVYFATDDREVVKAEIDNLPKDNNCHTLLFTKAGKPTCHNKFHFVFTTYDAKSGYHLYKGYAKGTCEHGQLGLSLAFSPFDLRGPILISTKGPVCKLY